jgi:hypothetical protein
MSKKEKKIEVRAARHKEHAKLHEVVESTKPSNPDWLNEWIEHISESIDESYGKKTKIRKTKGN